MTRPVKNMGWAAVSRGDKVYVDTVSETKRAAMVNALVVLWQQTVTRTDDDADIALRFKHACKGTVITLERIKLGVAQDDRVSLSIGVQDEREADEAIEDGYPQR